MKQSSRSPVLDALYDQPGTEINARAISELVARTGMKRPVIRHVRFKPEVSVVARIVDAAGDDSADQPWWFVSYSPSETNKAGKLLKRAAETGYPVFSALLPEDPRTSVFCGPIGLDRMLFKPLKETDAVGPGGQISGTVLSYNPWRRVVFRKVRTDGSVSVVRVWAEPPTIAPLLAGLPGAGVPVLPVIGWTGHSIEQPWLDGGDLAGRVAEQPRERDALLPGVARALASVHGVDPTALVSVARRELSPRGHAGEPHLPGVAAEQALGAASNGLACFPGSLRESFDAVAEAVLRVLADQRGPDVVSHGDFSADQVVLGGDDSPYLIDFDRLKLAPVGYDLGSFVAVEMLSGRDSATAAALVESYREVPGTGDASATSVRAWTAFHLLLRVAELFRNLDPHCVEHARDRIELARMVLAGRSVTRSGDTGNTASEKAG
ncbi:phosphotransferase family protein [Kocuria marina]|uniref:phosphotransferase family protein n=1 Tax=Kocuria marina TaxID=223184 RepID=UPI0022E07511|nr:aminoglycoside phosphotransferase family protein [Kocuria marina]